MPSRDRDNIRATPAKSASLAWLAGKLGQADEFARKPFGYDNPPVAAISDFFGIPATTRTLNRVAYGDPITNIGKANVALIPEDTFDAAMNIIPAGGAAAIGPANAVQATRTGRNVARAIGLTENSPTRVALDELARAYGLSGGNEMAVAVSPRGVAGPVRTGVRTGVTPGRKSRLSRFTEEGSMEDFHTHQRDGGTYYAMHPQDVQQSSPRKATTIVHTDELNRPTAYNERLELPRANTEPVETWSHELPSTYRDQLIDSGRYTTNVPEGAYSDAPYPDLGLLDKSGFNVVKNAQMNPRPPSLSVVQSPLLPLETQAAVKLWGNTMYGNYDHLPRGRGDLEKLKKELAEYLKLDYDKDEEALFDMADWFGEGARIRGKPRLTRDLYDQLMQPAVAPITGELVLYKSGHGKLPEHNRWLSMSPEPGEYASWGPTSTYVLPKGTHVIDTQGLADPNEIIIQTREIPNRQRNYAEGAA